MGAPTGAPWISASKMFRLTWVGTTSKSRTSVEEAERLRFVGSPTLLLDGQDPFAAQTAGSFGLSCRIYRTPEGPAGSPTTEQLREVLAAYLDGSSTS